MCISQRLSAGFTLDTYIFIVCMNNNSDFHNNNNNTFPCRYYIVMPSFVYRTIQIIYIYIRILYSLNVCVCSLARVIHDTRREGKYRSLSTPIDPRQKIIIITFVAHYFRINTYRILTRRTVRQIIHVDEVRYGLCDISGWFIFFIFRNGRFANLFFIG